MKIINCNDELSLEELAVSGARTSTLTGTAIDISQYQGDLKIILDSAAGTGTTPTLNGKIQTGDQSDGSDAADVSGAVFAQVVAAASKQSIGVDTRACKKYIRFIGTIAGTTPSFNFAVLAVGQKQVI
ncbi:MAG: hypothetical protein A3K22_00990 [Deltaproteobacteria bacterium RBG_16_42_7]|nr:MAG: hypothetical protein A3K22_00990 [Deltaproteobacteria bacterium RBG_16_42_7]